MTPDLKWQPHPLHPPGSPVLVAYSAVLPLVSPHSGPPPHRACEAGVHIQCLCGPQPGRFLANPVSGVVWSKEEAEWLPPGDDGRMSLTTAHWKHQSTKSSLLDHRVRPGPEPDSNWPWS
ncbi:unnamed protein product, partial [Rangifer tarandus platyrhynchus]